MLPQKSSEVSAGIFNQPATVVLADLNVLTIFTFLWLTAQFKVPVPLQRTQAVPLPLAAETASLSNGQETILATVKSAFEDC